MTHTLAFTARGTPQFDGTLPEPKFSFEEVSPMPLYGDLRTLSLEDLLRWPAANQKTGVLEVGRNAIYKWVEVRKGWVGSCSSNEP